MESKLSCRYFTRETCSRRAGPEELQQPGAPSLFRGEEFIVYRVVHHPRHNFSILILCQARRTMLEAQRNIEERKAVGKISRAIERVDIPPVGALEAGAGSLFAEDAVIGKLLVEPADDEFFRGPIGFGHQVYIAFVFRGDAAFEVSTKKLAGLKGNVCCAGRETQIKLPGKVFQGAILSAPLARRPRSLMVRI